MIYYVHFKVEKTKVRMAIARKLFVASSMFRDQVYIVVFDEILRCFECEKVVQISISIPNFFVFGVVCIGI